MKEITNQYEVHWWQERDSASIWVEDTRTNDSIWEASDDFIRELIEDGYIKWEDDYSVLEYLKDMRIIKEAKEESKRNKSFLESKKTSKEFIERKMKEIISNGVIESKLSEVKQEIIYDMQSFYRKERILGRRDLIIKYQNEYGEKRGEDMVLELEEKELRKLEKFWNRMNFSDYLWTPWAYNTPHWTGGRKFNTFQEMFANFGTRVGYQSEITPIEFPYYINEVSYKYLPRTDRHVLQTDFMDRDSCYLSMKTTKEKAIRVDSSGRIIED